MSDKLDCVAILAGGRATRMWPFTSKTPKSMLIVNGEPFVAHQLRLLRRNGIKRVVLCVGHLGAMVQDYVGIGEQFDMSVSYSFDGAQLLGTAGAIKKATAQLPEHFFLVYGDSFLECDYQQAWQTYCAVRKLGLMTIFRNRHRWDTSNVHFDGERILAYGKKQQTPIMEYIDYGMGIFANEAFAEVPESMPFDLEDLYCLLLKANQLVAFEVHSRFYEIGSSSGLRETRQYLARTNEGEK
jgi:NDP-sugar pyrophosphorylase family protein